MARSRKPSDLRTATTVARQLGVARNTVLYRVGIKRYESTTIDGVTFVVDTPALRADIAAAQDATSAAA